MKLDSYVRVALGLLVLFAALAFGVSIGAHISQDRVIRLELDDTEAEILLETVDEIMSQRVVKGEL